MISQSELIDVILGGNESNKPETLIRRGKVTGLLGNGEPQIQFAGEDTPRNKVYTRLSENVGIGDTVFLIQAFGSWLYLKDFTTSYKVE